MSRRLGGEMVGGWLALAALATVIGLAEVLTRRGRRPAVVVLTTGLTGLLLATGGALTLALTIPGCNCRTVHMVAVFSAAGLLVGLLVGSAFAGLNPTRN